MGINQDPNYRTPVLVMNVCICVQVVMLIGVGGDSFVSRLTTSDTFSYLCLQDGSTLLFGSERFFEHFDMLFTV